MTRTEEGCLASWQSSEHLNQVSLAYFQDCGRSGRLGVTNSPSENLGNLQPCSFQGVSDSSLGFAPLLASSQAELTLSFNCSDANLPFNLQAFTRMKAPLYPSSSPPGLIHASPKQLHPCKPSPVSGSEIHFGSHIRPLHLLL